MGIVNHIKILLIGIATVAIMIGVMWGVVYISETLLGGNGYLVPMGAIALVWIYGIGVAIKESL
jgi:hypothetical protein